MMGHRLEVDAPPLHLVLYQHDRGTSFHENDNKNTTIPRYHPKHKALSLNSCGKLRLRFADSWTHTQREPAAPSSLPL